MDDRGDQQSKNVSNNDELQSSANDLRQCASNWSLDSEYKLMRHIEQLHSTIIRSSKDLCSAIENTDKQTKRLSVSLASAQCDLDAVANNQFIESRVQQENATKPLNGVVDLKGRQSSSYGRSNLHRRKQQKQVGNGKSVAETERERLVTVQQALKVCSDTLNNEITILPGARNEMLFEPKNFYTSRPLPFLIGSSGFINDIYAGLRGTSYSDTLISSSSASNNRPATTAAAAAAVIIQPNTKQQHSDKNPDVSVSARSEASLVQPETAPIARPRQRLISSRPTTPDAVPPPPATSDITEAKRFADADTSINRADGSSTSTRSLPFGRGPLLLFGDSDDDEKEEDADDADDDDDDDSSPFATSRMSKSNSKPAAVIRNKAVRIKSPERVKKPNTNSGDAAALLLNTADDDRILTPVPPPPPLSPVAEAEPISSIDVFKKSLKATLERRQQQQQQQQPTKQAAAVEKPLNQALPPSFFADNSTAGHHQSSVRTTAGQAATAAASNSSSRPDGTTTRSSSGLASSTASSTTSSGVVAAAAAAAADDDIKIKTLLLSRHESIDDDDDDDSDLFAVISRSRAQTKKPDNSINTATSSDKTQQPTGTEQNPQKLPQTSLAAKTEPISVTSKTSADVVVAPANKNISSTVVQGGQSKSKSLFGSGKKNDADEDDDDDDDDDLFASLARIRKSQPNILSSGGGLLASTSKLIQPVNVASAAAVPSAAVGSVLKPAPVFVSSSSVAVSKASEGAEKASTLLVKKDDAVPTTKIDNIAAKSINVSLNMPIGEPKRDTTLPKAAASPVDPLITALPVPVQQANTNQQQQQQQREQAATIEKSVPKPTDAEPTRALATKQPVNQETPPPVHVVTTAANVSSNSSSLFAEPPPLSDAEDDDDNADLISQNVSVRSFTSNLGLYDNAVAPDDADVGANFTKIEKKLLSDQPAISALTLKESSSLSTDADFKSAVSSLSSIFPIVDAKSNNISSVTSSSSSKSADEKSITDLTNARSSSSLAQSKSVESFADVLNIPAGFYDDDDADNADNNNNDADDVISNSFLAARHSKMQTAAAAAQNRRARLQTVLDRKMRILASHESPSGLINSTTTTPSVTTATAATTVVADNLQIKQSAWKSIIISVDDENVEQQAFGEIPPPPVVQSSSPLLDHMYASLTSSSNVVVAIQPALSSISIENNMLPKQKTPKPSDAASDNNNKTKISNSLPAAPPQQSSSLLVEHYVRNPLQEEGDDITVPVVVAKNAAEPVKSNHIIINTVQEAEKLLKVTNNNNNNNTVDVLTKKGRISKKLFSDDDDENDDEDSIFSSVAKRKSGTPTATITAKTLPETLSDKSDKPAVNEKNNDFFEISQQQQQQKYFDVAVNNNGKSSPLPPSNRISQPAAKIRSNSEMFVENDNDDDDDDEGDLFSVLSRQQKQQQNLPSRKVYAVVKHQASNIQTKVQPKQQTTAPASNKSNQAKSRSIFDDNDDDDNLFGKAAKR